MEFLKRLDKSPWTWLILGLINIPGIVINLTFPENPTGWPTWGYALFLLLGLVIALIQWRMNELRKESNNS